MGLLEAYLSIAAFFIGFALLMALINLMIIAVFGPEEGSDRTWGTCLFLAGMGILFPLVVLLPFIGIYRLIKE